MEHLPREFVKPLEICFDLLGRSYIRIDGKKTSVISLSFFVLCVSFFFISMVTYASQIFNKTIEFFEFAYMLPVLMVVTQGILKAVIVVIKKPEIKDIIAHLGLLWRMDNLTETQTKRKKAALKRLNIVHNVYYWMNVVGTWQYVLAPLFDVLFHRFILQQQSGFLLPFGCSFPFDPISSWTRYIVVYVFEMYTMVHLIYIYLGAEFLLITLAALLSIQFSLLQEDVRAFLPVARNTNQNGRYDQQVHSEITYCKKNFKDIIQRHQTLILISEQLDEIFNKMIFANLLFASIIICFFGFVATLARSPAEIANNFVGVFASILPIFNLCYYGEMLTGSSLSISDAVYESLWYKGDINYQKMLLFIIKRSQQPSKLTSLKYAPISLGTFTTVMSTTWSYFSLVTSYTEK